MSTQAATPHSSFFTRHEKLALVLINVLFLALLLVAGEIAARISTGYDIGYYTEAKPGPDGKLHYPYGIVPVNTQGYLDEEFDLSSTKPRVGWFGDSVAMGVGAGYPYRISDLVRSNRSDINTWNFARIGAGFESEKAEKIARDYKLSTFVYLLNLNDILPESAPQSGTGFVVFNGLGFVKDYLDYFRDRSYLYNYIRTAAKNAFQRHFGLLPRQRRRSSHGRRDHRGCAGRALHPQEARSRLSHERHPILHGRRRDQSERRRPRRLLRQAVPQVRSFA